MLLCLLLTLYAIERQTSILFIDNEDSVSVSGTACIICILTGALIQLPCIVFWLWYRDTARLFCMSVFWLSLTSSHLSLNREGRWGTGDDFATSSSIFSLFSTALLDLPNSRPVHSLMLSSHLFLCLPCLLSPFTVPCKMVLARPDERETWQTIAVCISLSSVWSSRHWSPWHRLWRLCRDAQLTLPVLLALMLSHRYHQQSGDWWLLCIQCWQCLHDLLGHLSWSFPEICLTEERQILNHFIYSLRLLCLQSNIGTHYYYFGIFSALIFADSWNEEKWLSRVSSGTYSCGSMGEMLHSAFRLTLLAESLIGGQFTSKTWHSSFRTYNSTHIGMNIRHSSSMLFLLRLVLTV